MTRTPYATGTTTGVDVSLSQIRKLLLAAGSTHYAFGESPELASVQFGLGGRHYRFSVRRPTWDDLRDRYMRQGRVDQERAIEDEWKRRWRARLLWIKAMLEFQEYEPDAFAEAMLANLVLPDGNRMVEWAQPQIDRAYADGSMPPLLLAGAR